MFTLLYFLICRAVPDGYGLVVGSAVSGKRAEKFGRMLLSSTLLENCSPNPFPHSTVTLYANYVVIELILNVVQQMWGNGSKFYMISCRHVDSFVFKH